ncbi:MAG TPA: hypothetical protein VLM05_14415 [Mycobacteriales bacterium]|nr:hypothetical protein [Mycobacteriales bacterium]
MTVTAPDLPPAAGVDCEAVRSAAAALAPLAQPVADHGDRIVLTWRQIGEFYIAPETPVLLAALDPVRPLAETSGERIAGLGAALRTFADAAEPIIDELRRLGAGGPVTPEQAARMTALIEELAAVEQAAVAAIRSLTAFDPAPDRFRVGEQVDKASLGVTIGFVTIGRSAVFKETRFSDGTVFLTAVDAGELGATGSVGGVLSADAGFAVEAGSTWRFGSGPEEERFRAQLEAYVNQQRAVLFDDTGGAAAGVAIFGGVPPFRPPDQVVAEFALPASFSVAGEAGVLSGDVGAGATPKETVIRDLTSGSTTTFRSVEGNVAANGTITPLGVGQSYGGGFQALTGSATGTVRNAGGQLTKVILTSTSSQELTGHSNISGPGEDPAPGRHQAPGHEPSGTYVDSTASSRVTVTTTTLDVTDDNRAAVEQWVAGGQRDPGPLSGDPHLHDPATAVPGDAFQNALHDRAKVTRVTYDDVTDTTGFDASIKAGWTFGVEGSVESTTSHAGEGTYLGPEDANGVRHEVPIPGR